MQRHVDRRAADAAAALRPPSTVVTALFTTPVKGLGMVARRAVELTPMGVPDNRRFYLIDDDARMVNGKTAGALALVRADYEAASGHLTLCFPDGQTVMGVTTRGAEIRTGFFSRTQTARLVEGPWAEALSRYCGRALRLVESDPREGGVDRGPAGAVSLISGASLARLAAQADTAAVDPRRFRMLIEVAGPTAHEEDTWVGRTVRLGTARVAFHGHVGRCLVTTRSPDSGLVDLPTLDLLASYRRDVPTTERLAFGVFGEVLSCGVVTVGAHLSLE